MTNSFCAESALALTTRKPTVDHFSKTITASESFMRAAMHAENGECAYLQMLRESLPGYTFVRSKSRKPAKGQKKITYDKMRKYIRCLRDSKRLLEMFERVVVFGRSHDNPYQIVSEWFFNTFPDYGCVPEFDTDGYPIVETCVVPFAELQKKAAEKAKEEETPAEQSLQVVSGA